MVNQDITVYWRPGCGFCARLFRDIESAGLAHDRVNIWDDRDGASFVRSVANGNETVPTVLVGKHAMVNPSLQQIQAALS
ncbi:MAG: NrdH-redoxin [Acidimicrobiia bacterium]|nr:NrdH-redoxin [Acidimicrobiia bacterium]